MSYEVRVFSNRPEDGWRTLIHKYGPVWIETYGTLDGARDAKSALKDGYYGIIFDDEGKRVRSAGEGGS